MKLFNSQREKISEEQEQVLWREFKEKGSEEARETLATKYIHLVKYVINRLLSSSHIESEVLDYDDLFSVGVMGLLAAVDGFDLSRNVKFVTYAIPRIRGSIIDELRSVDWIPRSLRQQVNRLSSAYAELEHELLRPANETEIADRLGIDENQLRKLLHDASKAALLSLDEVVRISEDGSASRADMTRNPVENDPRDSIHREEVIELLTDAIEGLPDKERLVVVMYYNEELTLREIGEVIGVTESRICQLHTKAMMRLRGRLQAWQQDLVI